MKNEKNAMQRLNDLIVEKNSRICAGLDPTWEIIPNALKEEIIDNEEIDVNAEDTREVYMEEVIAEYCIRYIDVIKDVVPAIKINSAFFEQGQMEALYLAIANKAKKAGLFVIGDVKREDVGHTAAAYAKAYLGEDSPFDAITVGPFIGRDCAMQFLKVAKENGKGVFVLVKTSNDSSVETQDVKLEDGRKYYELIADLVLKWAEEVDSESFFETRIPDYPLVGAVVGATHPEQAKELRERMGCTFFLVPGYGAQGATADDVACNFNSWSGTGAIVNSSRGIMNAYKKDCWKDEYSEETWAEAAKAEAIRATEEINQAINKYYDENICQKNVYTTKESDDTSGIKKVLCCEDHDGVGDEEFYDSIRGLGN